LNKRLKVKIFATALLVMGLPFFGKAHATDYQCADPTVPCDGGDGSGTSCARQCPDGSWSGIGCLENETAHCSCSGYPVQANPYCTHN
jgi:hypothetical protein